MAHLATGGWEPDFPIGSWVECDMQGEPRVGLITNFDRGDGEYYVVCPVKDDPVESGFDAEEWIGHEDVTRLSHSPFQGDTAPNYIFMVIRPKRQISTYANLDALVEGLEVATAERDQQIREAAAQAVADPGTDIKIPTGAWLRFTPVEGA